MRNCYSCKYYKSNPAGENECLITGACNYSAHCVKDCEYYLNAQEESEVIE